MTLPDRLTLPTLRAAYQGGASPEAVIAAVLARIDTHADPAVWISRVPQQTLRAEAHALASQDRNTLPLFGVPFAVKDNIDAAGLPTTAACPDFAYTPEHDAPCVARLRAAGALLLGKTNLDQFATGLVGTRSPYGVPRNALDPARVPGGSSSGSAVAVAAGLAAFALGTDTAGSGRVPAAFNGIVGLKPTLGAVPTRGVVPACRTLDCVSLFAHGIQDVLDVYAVLAGTDAADPFSRAAPAGWRAAALPPARATLGVPRAGQREFFGHAASAAAYDAAIAVAAAHHDIVEIDLAPFLDAARLLYADAFLAERGIAIAGLPAQAIHPVVRGIIQASERFSARDLFQARYRLLELRAAASQAMAGCDALLLPTAPFHPKLSEVAADPVGVNARLGTYTNFVNLLDMAAIAVPTPVAGFGVSVIGPAWSEPRLAAIAASLTGESLEARPQPWPTLQIAVFGAHMRGLKLNHELRALGAAFVAEIATAPDYRLGIVPGTTPARPALRRVADGAGASIAGELWAVPAAAVGALLAAIPAPLALTRVRLADGRAPLGFGFAGDPAALGEDISAAGGFRAWSAAR